MDILINKNKENTNNTNFSSLRLADYVSPDGISGQSVNGTLEYEDEEYIFDRYSIQVLFIFLYSIVFVLCFLGNSIVLLVVSLHWKMRHITKLCLANLAFADLCVGIFCVYQNLSTYLIRSWVLGEFLCKMYQFINGLSHTASILTLVLVCVERYLAILHPFTCREILTRTRLRIIIAAIWIASGLYCSPRLVYMVTLEVPRDLEGSDFEIICTARRTLYDSRTFDMINSILLFLIPLVLMSVLYCRVGFVLWRSSEKLPLRWSAPVTKVLQHSSADTETSFKLPRTDAPQREDSRDNESVGSKNSFDSFKCDSQNDDSPSPIRRINSQQRCSTRRSNSSGRSADSRRKSFLRNSKKSTEITTIQNRSYGGRNELRSRQSVVKMLIVVVMAFALCHLPFHLRKIAVYWKKGFDLGSIWNTLFLALSHLSMYVNCAINPIIYAFMSASFRDCLRELVSCQLRRHYSRKPHSDAVNRNSRTRRNNNSGRVEQV